MSSVAHWAERVDMAQWWADHLDLLRTGATIVDLRSCANPGGMKLIPSREAVDFLARVAPRPWVQRLLRWMAFDEGLAAYSRRGKVQAYGSVADMTGGYIEEAGQLSGPEMDAVIRKNFRDEVAGKLIGKDPFSRFDDEPYEWDETGEPVQIDVGFFLFANEIDWDEGTIRADDIPSDGELRDIFFPESEFLSTELERAHFEAVIEGLSFEFSRIELLLPSLELGPATSFTTTSGNETRTRVGRPKTWDWEGALGHIVAVAQTPDGLPTGPGAQARIEEIMSAWFMAETGNSPAVSQVRQRAASIMRTLEKPKTPKTT